MRAGRELNISCCPFLRPISSCVDDRGRISSDDALPELPPLVLIADIADMKPPQSPRRAAAGEK